MQPHIAAADSDKLVSDNAWQAWLICISASLFFFYEFIQGNMFASIGEALMADFHIQASTMSTLSSVYYLSNVLFLFISAAILDRYSAKRTIIVAMALCVFGTITMALTHSFAVAIFCRFLTGIGSAFCFLGPVRIASRWFPANKMALVTGVIVTIAMAGGMAAQTPLTILAYQYGWRQSLLYVAALGFIILFVMMLGIKDKKEDTAHTIDPYRFSDALTIYLNPKNYLPAIYTSLMNAPLAIWGAIMGTTYLAQKLQTTNQNASIINSMLFMGMIFGGPLIGSLSDRMGNRVAPMRWSLFIAFFLFLVINFTTPSMGLMMVLFFILGFFCGGQVLSYALVAETNSPAITAMALSTISILTQGGYILYQKAYGAVLDYIGPTYYAANDTPIYTVSSYQSANIVLLTCFVVAAITLVLLQNFSRR
ncbi:MFS transporter [Legionella sp. W05-934-2]|jgi:MFS family permease|uniref:MFS transporter n=1 Tax=Legionella sp. W05-934-2 TaxID=1198649 RepID=UPI0034633857